MSVGKFLPVPPGHRQARCCGTCVNWEWGYEGVGECKLFPDDMSEWTSEPPWPRRLRSSDESLHTNHSTMLCDRWEKTPWGDPST